jgi:hypothetical protein
MKNYIISAAILIAMTASASAGGRDGGDRNTAVAVSGAQAKASAGAAAGAAAISAPTQNTNVSVDTPKFTFGAFASISSMANDSCGRVAFGIPYSAHTCNVLLEAAALEAVLVPIHGKSKAAQIALSHMVYGDRTMRDTLIRTGVIRKVN